MTEHLIPVFDIGGVFVDWNPIYLYRKIFDSEDDAAWFVANICTSAWNLEFDRGRRFEQGVNDLIARHPKYWREIEAYDLRWPEMTARIYEDTVALQDELIAAGLPVYAITNFSFEKWRQILPSWTFFQKFNGTIVSGLEGLVKPDYAIFSLFLERYDLLASECVFIDDQAVNISAAAHLGMKTIHVENPQNLRTQMVEIGLPVKAKP